MAIDHRLDSLSTLPEILSRLSSLQSAESDISVSLTDLLATREPIVHSLTSLQSLTPSLTDLHGEARLLSQTVSITAKTADHVGSRVRSLDEEMHRVREAAERVGQVMELKSCLASLHSSMENTDWESATRHCARAMALPLDLTSGSFAENVVPTQEHHLPPAQTLQHAREQLLKIFIDEFERASKARDAAATTRFFKLFPVIGWETEGLQLYASFVVDLVRVRAPASSKTSSPLYYVTALTALFESIALIIDQHQLVVEKYYGPGRMLRVLDRLLQESGRVTQGLLEGWEEQREMKRKISETAKKQRSVHVAFDEEDGIDPRDVDKVLTEMAEMSGRWGLFRKFMYDRLKDDPSTVTDNLNEPHIVDPTASSATAKTNELPMIEMSVSHQLFGRMLSMYYTPLEVWYTCTVIDKAHRLSRIDVSQSPTVTTTPDDAFYILKVVMIRTLNTGSLTAVDRMVSSLRDIIDQNYAQVLRKKLDDVYKTNSQGSNVVKVEKIERDNRQTFITLLNDLDISCNHLDRLITDMCESPLLGQNFMDAEVSLVRVKINSLANLLPKLKSILRAAIEQLFNQLLRPKLRNFVSDLYKDVSYVLDEDAYAAADYQDFVRKRFIKSWESLIDGYKDMFTQVNYGMFFGLALDTLLRPWERHVLTMRYSELGAIRFDRDLRSIISYLLLQTAFSDIREKFIRLQQISNLLNLDLQEDINDFYNGSGIIWQLSQQEATTITELRC